MNRDEINQIVYPMVSVIVPVYNVLHYLCEAIDSLIHQSYPNLEILIVDDGSTDGSDKICDFYAEKDNRIHVFHQHNKGLSAARNTGLNHINGEIIAFLDPDDAYHSRMIQVMVDEMKRSDSEIVVCEFSCRNTEGRMREEQIEENVFLSNVISRNEAFHRIVKRSINTAPWNKLYKSSLWNDLRFPDERVSEGTYLIFDVFSRAERVSLISEKLIMHRNRSGSICNTISVRNLYDSQIARNRFYSFVKKHTPDIFTSKELNRLKNERFYEIITTYLKVYCAQAKKTGVNKVGKELLIKTGDMIDIHHGCGLLKMVYQVILSCPGLCFFWYIQIKMLKKIICLLYR